MSLCRTVTSNILRRQPTAIASRSMRSLRACSYRLSTALTGGLTPTMTRDHFDDLAALRVGRVTAVEGRRIKVSVDKLKNGSHSLYRGAVIRNAAVGGYVKIAKGFADLIA